MNLLVIALVSSPHSGLDKLIQSLNYFKYTFSIIYDSRIKWDSNTHAILAEWLRGNKGEYTHILVTDGFDTLAIAPPEEVISKAPPDIILYSGEKNCFPRADWASIHPQLKYPWQYVNGGGFLAPIDLFLEVQVKSVRHGENDQEWAMDAYLKGEKIVIDNRCEIFQTLYMKSDDDFEIKGDRLLNLKTGAYPVFIHGNGRSDMNWVYQAFLK